MNKKLLAGLTAAGVLAGGASAAALITGGGAAPASATTAAAASSTPQVPCAGSALTSLVRKGTITKAQAAAVQQALWTYMRDHSGRLGEHMGGVRHGIGDMDGMWADGPMATVLRQLVNKGTITQAQATAITTAITQQMRTHWGHGHGSGMMSSHRTGMMGGQAGMMGDGYMWRIAPGPSPS